MRATILTFLAIAAAAGIQRARPKITFYLMGFFRDLARIKARKRLMDNNQAISTVDNLKMLFLKIEEDPLEGIYMKGYGSYNNGTTAHNSDLQIYTRQELQEFGDGYNGNPILLSLYGRVYDVSSGRKFYGPDGKYSTFAGRDVTKALSTGCLDPACLGSVDKLRKDDEFEMNDKTLDEGKKWIAFFESHDKYSLVGIMEEGQSFEELVDNMIEEEIKSSS
mmetsp:Transcript_25407/g.58636  ORF Transcript_25407/g.58636 Transcript_25407/m.58636 type:complete len:221 (-) Transcript_25407:516-1178(-)|eukprot:CAMPEP_0113298880 /NCGR_PEP_ID=MMETSP0010_2-20120614/1139_1 /TAXON_ID=216773 ORGANISM="Corethron hystrix, Strain 308" /NCGR_SAMPLE_ID=MMETSP0010_2 /ASSEMBLY_ACC=CAM_ASM_000155 /LENGTH=220 /DNA_ID=CAMNT_0000152005 /DNA_START=241 /DNA_END=903 /DNA_ORIENTATION=- /assembly_acc=CAM_ASM_000155